MQNLKKHIQQIKKGGVITFLKKLKWSIKMLADGASNLFIFSKTLDIFVLRLSEQLFRDTENPYCRGGGLE